MSDKVYDEERAYEAAIPNGSTVLNGTARLEQACWDAAVNSRSK